MSARRRHPCFRCETPTRRTRGGWFVCSRCADLTPEERLLAAIFNVSTDTEAQRKRLETVNR